MVRVSAPLPLGTYPYSTGVAVNTKRSLVERTVSDEKVQPSRKKIPLHLQLSLFPLCVLEKVLKLRRRASFATKSPTLCVLFDVHHV